MARVAHLLDLPIDEDPWPAFVEAATIGSMRSRATITAPNADIAMWRSPEGFFKVGGTRGWASHLEPADLDHFHDRLRGLAGDAAEWVLRGRAALT
jgi:hypothetical protein